MATGSLKVLTRGECLALLGQAGIGRVGVSLGAIPEVFPVHFCLMGDAIVFRTGAGTKLHAASHGAVVAFEVDEFEIDARCGWSVLVIGRSGRVRHPVEIHEARQQLQPDGWVPGDRDQIVRIMPHKISGRRIEERHSTSSSGRLVTSKS
jgi:nitroimidazol reductase NimA-like FMN-containing flavoprotein (pyridoxamine 5'-phosphate oxidase superfamily)